MSSNVLLVVVDQLRFDCVGFSQMYPVHTPNIDNFAAKSTWFASAFTPIPTCCPARQSFLTGKRAEALGALWNYDLGSPIHAIDATYWSWSKALSDAGYDMSYIGKWHVSPQDGPEAFGFSHNVSEPDYLSFQKEHYPDLKYSNGFFGEEDTLPLEHTPTHWLTARAVEELELRAQSDQPWLVRLDLSEPHLPCRPAKPFSEFFGPDDIPKWSSFDDRFNNKPYMQRQQLVNWRIEDFGWDDWAPIVARYYNVIAQVDDAFGIILEALERTGKKDDTMVIFTSDHGDMCGAHRMLDKHYVLYDDVVRVPLIVGLPGQTEGRKCEDFVYNTLDLAPTILESAGVETPDGLHGKSLMPILCGEADSAPRQAVVSTFNGQQFGLYSQRMLRQRNWKYIWNATDIDELYDLKNDPAELINIAGHPEHVNRLAEMRRILYNELIGFGDSLVENRWMKDQFHSSRKLGLQTLSQPDYLS